MKICLVSHGHPAANPRLVREADALYGAGHDVSVVTPRFVSRLVPFDREILNAAGWRYRCIDFLDGDPVRWRYIRFRRRVAAFIANTLPSESLVARACNYSNPELARLATEQHADLYVAHQHHSLPAVARASANTGASMAFDAEDLLADSSAEPRNLIRSLEIRYLSRCAYISTMSHAAARRLQETNDLNKGVEVLHNTLPIADRKGVLPPAKRTVAKRPSIYWFGQTIGKHSRADQAIRAIALLSRPVRLVLRGEPHGQYVQQLSELATRLNLREHLEIEPLDSPGRMVRLASEHDVLLGSQPGPELFHQMAIGNKVFTGMMAGLALALTDTIAHRELLARAGGCGFLFSDADEKSLARELEKLLADPGQLRSMKQSSWDWAASEYNWETDSRRHVAMVESLIPGSGR